MSTYENFPAKTAILSILRVTIFSREGNPHHFNLYRDASVAGLFSPCMRVRVFTNTNELNGEKITIDDQFTVFVNDKRVPDRQFTILRARKPKQAGKHQPPVVGFSAEQREALKRRPMNR